MGRRDSVTARGSGLMRRLLRIALAVVLMGTMATPITWSVAHEWLGMALIALSIAHVAAARRRVPALVRQRSVGSVAALALDLSLLVCLVGLGGSAVVLSKHVLAWLPPLAGAMRAREVHMECSYWLFALAAVHSGLHGGGRLKRLVGRCAPGGKGRFAIAGVCLLFAAFGAWSFVSLGVGSYLLGIVRFAQAVGSVPLAFLFAEHLASFALVAFLAAGLKALAARKAFSRK